MPSSRVSASSQSLRILYVTGGFPYPLTSGLLRHYFLIRELAQKHAVALLSIVGPDFVPEHEAALAPFTSSITTFEPPRHRSSAGKAAVRIRSFLPGLPTRSPVAGLADAGARLISDRRFDVVFFSGKYTHPALPAFKALPVAVDMCDASSKRILGNLRVGARTRMPILLAQYLEMRRAERRLAKAGDHLLFASARDRDALLDHRTGVAGGDRGATVLPNGVDAGYWRRATRELGQRQVVFTGAMDWPPNHDAALHLIEDVMPLVLRSVPDARLSIVGRAATPELRRAAAGMGATVTGFVEDVRPYLEQASVFAAPLRFGAGIQNKLLEAMAMEVPVVASPLAADGLRTDEGRDPPLTIAAHASEFANRIVERLGAVEQDPAPDGAARRFVEAQFTWRRSGEVLEEVLKTLSRSGSDEPRRPLLR